MKRVLLFVCALAWMCLPASAAPVVAASAAEATQAHHERKWLALLHYRPHAGGYVSDADRPAFFLAPNGKHSPGDELAAALDALRSNRATEFACRFPARYEWLVRRFGLFPDTQPDSAWMVRCPELQAWYARFPGTQISINFASSYMESPSSMFGHTFLKIYQDSNRSLLSPTINYAARTAARESELSFVRKGLFGGFPGVVDELPFYRRLRSYSENEGRDIWEYQLALSPEQLRTLLLHVWEIRDGIFDYYFIGENCAYRTLALIDVARPELGLLAQFARVTVPVETVRTLKANGLVLGSTYWPAYTKRVRQHEQQLGSEGAQQARAIANGAMAGDTGVQNDPRRQAGVLQLAYEYQSLQINRDQAARETAKATMNAIVRQRLALATDSGLTELPASATPDQGHRGSPLSLGLFDSDGRQGYLLGWAGFQHTLGDPLAGYEPYAEIAVLKAQLRFGQGQAARLQRIDWLALQSTDPGSSLLGSSAWRLLLSTRDRDFVDGQHRVTGLDYGRGRAWPLGPAVLAVMPGVGLEMSRAQPHDVALSGTLSVLLSHQGERWSTQMAWEAGKFVLGSRLYRSEARLKASLALGSDSNIAISARRSFHPRASDELLIEYQYFR
jgi:hypothetical protein